MDAYWNKKDAQLVGTNADGTMTIRCCRPDCDGVRTNAPSAWRWASVPCDECIELYARKGPDPLLDEPSDDRWSSMFRAD